MIIGSRIDERLSALGYSQSKLARLTGLNQSTISGLIRGDQRSSTHLHKIAQHLQTTSAYLEGDTDNPDANAPLPPVPPSYQAISLQVLLPSEAALARMFLGLLKTSKTAKTMDEQALLLAKRLPNALSQLRDLLPDTTQPVPPPAERPAVLATPDHEHRR